MAGTASNEGAVITPERSLEAAHSSMRADQNLQFRFEELPPPEPPPPWLRDFSAFMQSIGPIMRVIFWIGVGVIVAFVLYVLVSEIMKRAPARWRFWKRKEKALAPAPKFKPSAARARTLLEEADRLAAEGRYSEAVRVLLHRSIEDIEQAFPVSISPALTSREIASLDPLSDHGRRVFSGIAAAVETSLFGGRALDRTRFAECRAAYASFALGGRR